MDLTLIEEKIKNLLTEKNLHLYSFRYYKQASDYIMEVLTKESLDLDSVSLLSQDISALLDEIDKSEDTYLLDVSCAGSERKLEMDELEEGLYVHLTLKDKSEVEGEIKQLDQEKLSLVYKEKNKTKTSEILLTDITEARLAIKF